MTRLATRIFRRTATPALLAAALLPAAALANPNLAMPAGHAAFQAPQGGGQQGFSGKVLEVLKASRYVYLHVDTGSAKHWVASPGIPVKVGDTVQVPPGMIMSDFESPELGKKFPQVFFVGGFQVGGAAAGAGMPAGHPPLGGHPEQGPRGPMPTPPAAVTFEGLNRAAGGLTVEEIFAQSADLNGKEVSVRGKIVKTNFNIMDRNWLHLRDGTGQAGSDDLLVTSSERAAVGDTVLVKGTLATKADFGYGYKYDVVLEKASITVEAPNKEK